MSTLRNRWLVGCLGAVVAVSIAAVPAGATATGGSAVATQSATEETFSEEAPSSGWIPQGTETATPEESPAGGGTSKGTQTGTSEEGSGSLQHGGSLDGDGSVKSEPKTPQPAAEETTASPSPAPVEATAAEPTPPPEVEETPIEPTAQAPVAAAPSSRTTAAPSGGVADVGAATVVAEPDPSPVAAATQPAEAVSVVDVTDARSGDPALLALTLIAVVLLLVAAAWRPLGRRLREYRRRRRSDARWREWLETVDRGNVGPAASPAKASETRARSGTARARSRSARPAKGRGARDRVGAGDSR